MKQSNFFAQLYYLGCKPSLIFEQIKSGSVSESEIKKSSVKDFVKYLSSMKENISETEQDNLNKLMDIYIHNNKKIQTTIKIKGNPISFLGYLLINTPISINNIKYLIKNHNLNVNPNNEILYLSLHALKYSNFSKEHKLKLLLFFNDLDLNLSPYTTRSKKDILNFYFSNILKTKDDFNIKSFISFDLKNFKSEDDVVLFQIIKDLPFSQLQNKYDFIQDEIKYIIKKFEIIFDNSFDNIKKLCIQNESVLKDISTLINDNNLNEEDSCLDFFKSYLFNFMYEDLTNSEGAENNILINFINTLNSFSDSFHLKTFDSLCLYTSQPLNIQSACINNTLSDKELNQIKKDKLDKFSPLLNYLKVRKEQIKIKESLKENKLTQTEKNKKRI